LYAVPPQKRKCAAASIQKIQRAPEGALVAARGKIRS
jgi:hypothetical protein